MLLGFDVETRMRTKFVKMSVYTTSKENTTVAKVVIRIFTPSCYLGHEHVKLKVPALARMEHPLLPVSKIVWSAPELLKREFFFDAASQPTMSHLIFAQNKSILRKMIFVTVPSIIVLPHCNYQSACFWFRLDYIFGNFWSREMC